MNPPDRRSVPDFPDVGTAASFQETVHAAPAYRKLISKPREPRGTRLFWSCKEIARVYERLEPRLFYSDKDPERLAVLQALIVRRDATVRTSLLFPATRRRILANSEKAVRVQMGERIALLRRSKGWKQRELASRIRCTLPQVSKLERGLWMPRASLLLGVSQTFNVTTDYLLTGREPRNPDIDLRLRERLPALESLPLPQRDALVEFLDALVLAHRYAGFSLPADESDLPNRAEYR
jgi:transcriptional regulator with XRE-family HTH domain